MVDPIPMETVNEMADLLGRVPPGRADQLVDQLRREQPAIYDYMVALARPPLNQREHDYIFSAVVIVWQILKNSARPPGQVRREALVRARRAMMRGLLRLAQLPPEVRQGHITLQVKAHPEPYLLAYTVVVVERKPDPPFDTDARLVAHEALRVVLESLLASRPRERPLKPAGKQSAG